MQVAKDEPRKRYLQVGRTSGAEDAQKHVGSSANVGFGGAGSGLGLEVRFGAHGVAGPYGQINRSAHRELMKVEYEHH